jgi:hypothetical protein
MCDDDDVDLEAAKGDDNGGASWDVATAMVDLEASIVVGKSPRVNSVAANDIVPRRTGRQI